VSRKRSSLNNNALRELMASNKQKNESPNVYYEDLVNNPDAIHRVNINQITSYSQGSELKEFVGITLEESRDMTRDEALIYNNSMSIFRSSINFIFGERQTARATQIVRVATTRDNFMPDAFELAGNNQSIKQKMIEYHTLAMIDETVLDGMQKIPERTPVKIMFFDNNKEMAFITSIAREQVEISQTTAVPVLAPSPPSTPMPNGNTAQASTANDLATEMLALFGGDLDIRNAYVSTDYQPTHYYTPCGFAIPVDSTGVYAGKLLDYDYIPSGLPETVKKTLCFAMKCAGWSTGLETSYGYEKRPHLAGYREIGPNNTFDSGLKVMFDDCNVIIPEGTEYSTGGLKAREPYCAAITSWWISTTLAGANYPQYRKTHELFARFSPFKTMIKYTAFLVNWGKKNNKFFTVDEIINGTMNPSGMIFHMGRAGSGSDTASGVTPGAGHTGLVIGYNRKNNFILTVEGNTSFTADALGARADDWITEGKREGVTIKTRDPRTLIGFSKWW